MLGVTRHWKKRRFYLLFLTLLVYLVCYPFVEHTGSNYVGFRIFGALVTVVSVYAVSSRRRFIGVALAVAAPTLFQRILLTVGNENLLSLLAAVFGFVFDLIIIVVIFRRVFGTDRPDSETIFGALCVYLLVGFSFASGYLLLAAFQPYAFIYDPSAHFHLGHSRFRFIYYSFGTLTSLGAAGMTPGSDEARSLSIIQAILGVLYLAVLIARLIGLYKAPSSDSKAF